MTMVEIREKISELGAARAQYPYGTPEFQKANEALRKFTREQLLSDNENISRFVFYEFCEDVEMMAEYLAAYPDNQEIAAEMKYFRETEEWLRENGRSYYAAHLNACINGAA